MWKFSTSVTSNLQVFFVFLNLLFLMTIHLFLQYNLETFFPENEMGVLFSVSLVLSLLLLMLSALLLGKLRALTHGYKYLALWLAHT